MAFLRDGGFDAVHVRDLGMQRALDREVIGRAASDQRILLTFDLDFGEILALGIATEPSVIIFRLSDETAPAVNARLAHVLRERPSELADGALILVEDTRYRVRRLPIGMARPSISPEQ